ncbi:DUF427 domain-containing protein [Streptomyces parvulus]|uniref:DUF427 domain-containing protein n=1 Tax=Streptomyces parvulus TaxID=146923 RepID=UPI003F4DC408
MESRNRPPRTAATTRSGTEPEPRWEPRPDGGRPDGRLCAHTRTAFPEPLPLSEVCLPCAAGGRHQIGLRHCLTCGHVGCSDSSPGAHASAHFDDSGHPVVRSLAPGEDWAWCYEDQVYLDPAPRGRPDPTAPASSMPESVWDYPRPPALREDARVVRVECAGHVVAETREAVRVLETSHPPVFYVPPSDVATELLRPAAEAPTWCEWKGEATYWDAVVGSDRRSGAAWSYPAPAPGYERIAGFFAFYPGRMDRCTVGDQVVGAQRGDFYGGWITAEVRGPFKGAPGTGMW